VLPGYKINITHHCFTILFSIIDTSNNKHNLRMRLV